MGWTKDAVLIEVSKSDRPAGMYIAMAKNRYRMKDTRLESKNKDFVHRLRKLPHSQQRRVALAAADWALRANHLSESDLGEAVRNINKDGASSPEIELKLQKLVEKLDAEYFDAQEAGASEAEFIQIFSKARAVSALLLAGGADIFVAAAEAIYEASVSTEDEAPLFDLMFSLLQQ